MGRKDRAYRLQFNVGINVFTFFCSPLITEEAWSAFLSRDLDWEVAVVGLNRRMNDIWVMIPKSGMVVRTQAIWAPDAPLFGERT